jgi:bacteriorhodopsin
MKALYRIVAVVLTIASAFAFAALITALTGSDRIVWGYFAVFAVGAVVALGAAFVLWARAASK